MKYSMWITAVIALTMSVEVTAVMDNPFDLKKASHEYLQASLISMEQGHDQTVSAEGQSEEKQQEFADRLTELRNWESDLKKQAIDINQEILYLQSQLAQNRLELERITVDQKDVQRNIKELEREKASFERKTKIRKITDLLQSGQ